MDYDSRFVVTVRYFQELFGETDASPSSGEDGLILKIKEVGDGRIKERFVLCFFHGRMDPSCVSWGV